MKGIILNTMATTGLALVILSVFVRVLLPGFDLYFTFAVFQTFAANIVIHLGLALLRKFESKYLVVEVLLDIVYTTVTLIVFGFIFDWFGITPVWALIVMAITINLASLYLYISRFMKDANTINSLLKKRNKNKNGHEKEVR